MLLTPPTADTRGPRPRLGGAPLTIETDPGVWVPKRIVTAWIAVAPGMNGLIDLYQSVADSIGPETGASDSLLHVHAGMVILLTARLITRRSLATPLPFLVVLAVALLHELTDYLYQEKLHLADAVLDVLNTIFWPFVLMLGLRVRRARKSPE